MAKDVLDDLLADAAGELRNIECPTLAAAVEIARQRLSCPEPATSEVRLASVDPDVFDADPDTGTLILSVAEACHA